MPPPVPASGSAEAEASNVTAAGVLAGAGVASRATGAWLRNSSAPRSLAPPKTRGCPSMSRSDSPPPTGPPWSITGASARRWKFFAAEFTKTSALEVSDPVTVTPPATDPRRTERSTPIVIVPGDPNPIEVTVVATAALAPAIVAWTAVTTTLPVFRVSTLFDDVTFRDAAPAPPERIDESIDSVLSPVVVD